jgi:hypothetical protein
MWPLKQRQPNGQQLNILVLLLVNHSTVGPDLTGSSGERTDVPHLDHRRDEVGEEGGVVGAVGLHQRVLRAAVVEFLVGVEQAFVLEQVPIVGVVEGELRLQVERRQDGVVDALRGRAVALAQLGELLVDVVVVVDAGAVDLALREADGVRAGEGRHVLCAQALVGERRNESAEAGRRRGEVAVRLVPARRRRVAPAERHVPGWPTELQQLITCVNTFDNGV